MEIKIILKAKDIPDDSIVTKINGTQKYIIKSKIVIYSDKKSPLVINAEEGSKFIVADNKPDSISAIDGDKELVWNTETDDLIYYLSNKDD